MNTLALALWIAVAVSTLALALGLRQSRRRHGSDGVLHDLTEAAFLSGGPRRVVDTALVALCQDGRMMIGGPGIVQVRSGARAADPVERAVLRAHEAAPSGALHALRLAVMRDPAVQETGDGLAARGLLAEPGTGTAWRRWGLVQALVCLMLVPVAFALTVVQWASADSPYQFDIPLFALAAPALFLGMVAGLVLRSAAGKRVTAAGKAALDAYRRSHLASADLAVRTALQGPRALPDPLLRMQLTTFPVSAGRARGGSGGRSTGHSVPPHSCGSASGFEAPVVWCAGSDGGGGSGGSGCGSPGSGCGSSGSGCGSSGSSCGSSGSSCGSSSSSCSSGSSCGSSSGSSCGSSSS